MGARASRSRSEVLLGGLRGAAGPFLAAVLAALAALLFARAGGDGLAKLDAFDFADIARQLVRGEGFSSRQIIYNLHLRFLEEHGLLDGPWPNLHRFPLPPIVLALFFRLGGTGDAAVVAQGIVFHAATAALLFHWARRALGLAPAGAACALFASSGVLLESATSGLSEPLAMFFFTLALYALWRLDQGAGRRVAFLAGVAFGLAGLARTNVLFVWPLCALFLLLPGQGVRTAPSASRGARTVLFGLGVVLVSAPWWIRNTLVAGSPFFSLHSYFLIPSEGERKWDLTFPWVREFVRPLDALRAYPDLAWWKWRTLGGQFLAAFPWLGSWRLVAPLALGAMVLRGPMRRVAGLLFASLLVSAALQGMADMFLERYYFHFLPGVLLLGLGVLWRGVERLVGGTARWTLRTSVFALLAVVALDLAAIPAASARTRDTGVSRANLAFVAANTDPEAVILSDQSYALTWYADRRTVRTHYLRNNSGAHVLALHYLERSLPLDGLYLSADFLEVEWKRQTFELLQRDRRFESSFPHHHRFPDGALFYWR